VFRGRKEEDKKLDQAMEEVDLTVVLQAVEKQDMPLVAIIREEVRLEGPKEV